MSLPLDEQIIKNFTLKSWPDSNRQFLLQEQYGCKCASLLCIYISVQLQILSIKTICDDGFLHTLRGYVKAFTAAFPFKLQDHSIGDRTRTCSLSVPNGGSDQSEYSYIFSKNFFKSVPAASHGERLFLLPQ